MAHAPAASQVRVGVRIRPLTSQEIQQGGKISLDVTPPSLGLGQRRFTYDAVFDSNVSQVDLYDNVSTSLLHSFVDGYNATIMAYGQTGSGKTFTMGSEAHSEPESSTHSGLIPRFMSDFFHSLQKKKEESDKGKEGCPVLLGYSLTASFLEVYGEEIFDLLDEARKPLPLREDSHGGVVISGLTSRSVSNVVEALQVLHEGTMNRTTAATLMNLTSSRSHAVFTINLNQIIRSESCGDVDLTTTSQFTFVDLAGSERMKKTGAEGERAREGIMINQGLLALGNVINALADEERLAKDKKVHVPYRQSKLTRLLQDALGGNSQTLFLACVSPSDTNASETLSTLHYANRARNIRNAPTKNIDATAAELQRLHSVTRVLQCELIKQKFFQDQLSDKENIGEIDLEVFKRIDVVEYLRKIHAAAGDMQRVPLLPVLPDPADTVVTPSKYLALPPNPAQSTMTVFQPSPGSRQVLDATPNKSISERFDDSFLLDANPIEDMAILDRLLELQQHDHEYDSEQKKDDEELKQVVGELEKQENMLLQLRENLKVYHSLKEKYEALMGEVQQLEAEKLGLAEQLERATADPSSGCSEAIKRKLETVELGLVRARNETKKHREKYRKAEEQAKKCQVLERKVNELKQGKATLLKKQKEAAAKYREVTERKTKELLALKRRERVTGQKMSKLEMEIQHHKSNLDKRKEYCDKISSKLKQTESHLMKLLSMRSRELSERTSLAGPGPLRRRTNEFVSSHGSTVEEGLAAPTSEDTKSIRFVLFKMVEDKVNQANLAHEYEDRVNVYSNIVRLMVAEMKKLEEAKRQQASDKTEKSREAVTNIEEAVAELELKLELVSSELDQLRSKLPKNPEESRLDADEAVVKLMSAMSAPVLRTLLLETFSKYADVEMKRQRALKSIERKDSALKSFESEVETLNNRIGALSKDVSRRRSVAPSGAEPMLMMKRLQEENATLRAEIALAKKHADDANAYSAALKKDTSETKRECSEARELLTIAEMSLPKTKEINCTKETIQQLQNIWKELGVDPTLREKARMEIETCLQDTCNRKLAEASGQKLDTEIEILAVTQRLDAMKVALGNSAILIDKSQGSNTLFESLEALQIELNVLEPRYRFAIERRDKILKDTLGLTKSMSICTDQLPLNLRELIVQTQSAESPSIQSGKELRASIMEDVQGMISAMNHLESRDVLANIAEEDSESEPENPAVPERHLLDDVFDRLDDRFLSACESDVTALRVRKSEILVRNQELHQESRALASEMHLSPTDIVVLVERSMKHHEQGLPGWWNKDLSHDVAFTLGSTGGPVGVTSDFTQHLALMREALTRLSQGRRALSLVLRGIVERAQKTLLDIVGRELDASEAYASFHDALFRLPALSKELIYACISEMDALAVGVEAMTQSEIEALSVVWESVNTPSADRRGFWGQVEESSTRTKNNEDAFGEVVIVCSQEGEEWVADALEKTKRGHVVLENRLFKLEMIHQEVEKLRSRQDSKSQILSLDSEVRILNAKLSDFEDLQCSKQRLTKRSAGTALLKEERFRRQMQGKFASKLEQLASLLRAWNSDEGEDFDSSLLSEDVRMLLSNPGKMETWVEQRTKFMPLRTVQTKTAVPKRPVEHPPLDGRPSIRSSRHKSGISPPRARPPQSNSTRMKAPQPGNSDLPSAKRAPPPLSFRHSQKRKPDEMQKVTVNSSKAPRTPTALSPSNRQLTKKGGPSTGKESVALLPFGHVLSDVASPEAKENLSL